jgi:hypothetical protein
VNEYTRKYKREEKGRLRKERRQEDEEQQRRQKAAETLQRARDSLKCALAENPKESHNKVPLPDEAFVYALTEKGERNVERLWRKRPRLMRLLMRREMGHSSQLKYELKV